MRMKTLKLLIFCRYKDSLTGHFLPLQHWLRENDVGKSKILEALDIFFSDSKNIVKAEIADVNIRAAEVGNTKVEISALFEDLPDMVIINVTYRTSRFNGYLFNADGSPEVIKRYSNDSPQKY